MRISDWSSDVCSSDLHDAAPPHIDHGVRRAEVDGHVLGGEFEKSREDRHACSCSAHPPAKRTGTVGKFAPRSTRPLGQPKIFLRLVSRGKRSLDRKSVVEGKSVSVRVALGGRRLITKNINEARSSLTARCCMYI